MAIRLINSGSTVNDNTGDTLRVTADKINKNFQEMDSVISSSISVTDHDVLANIGVTRHVDIDAHILDTEIHFSQSQISITESQISDLSHYTDSDTLSFIDGKNVLSGSQVTSYDDLTDIPSGIISGSSQLDGTTLNNITASGVFTGDGSGLSGVQGAQEGIVSGSIQVDHNETTNYSASRHFEMADISITEAQISDLSHYTDLDAKALLDAENVISGALDLDGIVSSSSQIDHDQTTNYQADEHFTQAEISITEAQISDLSHYTDSDTETYINSKQVASGSNVAYTNVDNNFSVGQIIRQSGSAVLTVSGSAGELLTVRDDDSSNIFRVNNSEGGNLLNVSSSGQVDISGSVVAQSFIGDGSQLTGIIHPALPTGVVSGSSQVVLEDTTGQLSASRIDGIPELPAGVVSGSSQIDHDQTTNYVAGEHFLQSEISITESQISDLSHTVIPDGTVSGSDQISGSFVNLDGDMMTGILDMGDNNIVDVDQIRFKNTGLAPSSSIYWDNTDATLYLDNGIGHEIHLGRDLQSQFYNTTGGVIPKNTIVSIYGAALYNGTEWLPTVIIPSSDRNDTVGFNLMMTVAEVGIGEKGIATRTGTIYDYDTSAWAPGTPLYLSSTISGSLTSSRPSFPAYEILVAGVTKQDATTGKIVIQPDFDRSDTFDNFHNGTMRESFDIPITSNGTIITATLNTQDATDELTMLFSSGRAMLAEGSTISLTAGTDTAPILNYLYIPESTKVMTQGTTGWPTGEHIKLGTFLVQSPTTVQANGALKNHLWNDHVQDTGGQGHLSHITHKLRKGHAQWDSGTEGSLSTDGTNIWLTVTSGKVFQIHEQTFESFNTETGDTVHVYNDPTTPFVIRTNLNAITADSTGGSLANSSYSLVLWGVVNSSTAPDQLMINLPGGSYSKTTPEDTETDLSGYTNYAIPNEFKGTGFLIAKFNILYNGGVYTIYSTEDLRGIEPNVAAGGAGGGGGGATTFLGLVDTPGTYVGSQYYLPRVNSTSTALEFKSFSSLLPVGVVSGSSQITISGTTGQLPVARVDGAISSSAQVNHNATTNWESGRHFLQSEITITESQISDLSHYTDTDVRVVLAADGVLTSQDGTVISGSSQVDVTQTTNYSSIEQYNDADNLLYMNTIGVISGSIPSSISSSLQLDDTDNIAYRDQDNNFLVGQTISGSLLVTGSNGELLKVEDGTGSLNVEGTVTADFFVGDGSQLTGLGTIGLPSGVVSGSSQITLADTVGQLTASRIDGIITELPAGVVSGSSQIDHDATTNFVANEHIDWTIDQGGTMINEANYLTGSSGDYVPITGDTNITGSISIYDSGSTVLTVSGSAGELMTISDDITYVSGSLINVYASGSEVFSMDENGSTYTTGQYNLRALNLAPSSTGDNGTLGEIRVTSTHIYVCTATNTWKRVAIATW